MIYQSETPTHVNVECEACERRLKIPRSNCQASSTGFSIIPAASCPCGVVANTITKRSGESYLVASGSAGEKVGACPKCRSTQIAPSTQGFGAGKAAAGGLLLGPVGLLAGFFGSRKVTSICAACGHRWVPGR
jgi:hypothetical protein